jgi:Domain of unknown function (DUF3859)
LVACAKPPSAIDVNWIGLYTVASSSQIDEANSLSGQISQSSGPRHELTTTRIPAVIGTRFGISYVINDPDRTRVFNVRYVWRFPEGGLDSTTTGRSAPLFEIRRSCRVGETCSTAWVFNHDWELKPGTWTAEIWLDEKKELSRDFEIYLP